MNPFDAFNPDDAFAFRGYDVRIAERFWREVDRAASRLGVVVEGTERIPKGRALLVMNHAFGWDAMLPMAAIRRATGRRVGALGEHLWWKLPLLRKARGVGRNGRRHAAERGRAAEG
jgi:hypothetical protein